MDKPLAIICDLDGTLALLNGRDPISEQNKLLNDGLNERVAEAIRSFSSLGYAILYMTGRWEEFSDLTIKWLALHNMPVTKLYARPYDNTWTAPKLKEWYLDNVINRDYRVVLALDDLYDNIKMFRRNGIEAWQVAEDPWKGK